MIRILINAKLGGKDRESIICPWCGAESSCQTAYCATIPFEGAEPERYKQWVEDNIAKCNEAGKVETLKVGNVEFSLYGTGNSARYLDIKSVKE